MIGYYVHHVGRGHLHRALAVTRHLPGPVTALSSLLADDRWPGDWVTLPRDDAGDSFLDPTAGGALHWAPLQDDGLRSRMALIAEWIAVHRPSVMVVDLSVEVIMLARLMGVPVVTVSLPGVRDDAPHQRGYELADAIVAPWPESHREAGPSLERFAAKVRHVGAISRYESRLEPDREPLVSREPRTPRVLMLSGLGGDGDGPAVPRAVPGWEVQTIGAGQWNPDPWNEIRAADVVVTHAGLGALADVAVARRPAVIVPQPRPHEEQVRTAAALARSGLAVVADPVTGDSTTGGSAGADPAGWLGLLEQARRIGGSRWPEWADGHGGERMARVVLEVAERST